MIEQVEFSLAPRSRGMHLVTREIEDQLPNLPKAGLVQLFILHTSAALTINENADPDVRHDMAISMDKMVPEDQAHFLHTLEGSDDMPAHIKTSLFGNSLTIPVKNGRLYKGTWQGIYLCEFRNRGGARRVMATVIS